MPRRTASFLALILLASPLSLQAIPFWPYPIVTTEHDHSAQFAHRTYSWGSARMAVPRYTDTVKAMVDNLLKARGWQLVPSGGSATIFALGDTPNGLAIQTYYAGQGDGWAQGWGPQGWGAGWKPFYGEAVYNAMGTAENHLVLDIFDTSSHRLIFRGVTAEDLSNSEKKNDKTLAKSLKKMMKGMPKS